MESHTVIWKRHDLPGHEACRVRSFDTGWKLGGAAVFVYMGQACRLDYLIDCDSQWVTRSAVVTAWIGDEVIDVTVMRDATGQWRVNGRAIEEVAGCVDFDLNFSPSTNLLPIRRLGLKVGAMEPVRAAWLRFPSFAFEPLDQSYARLESRRYRYESAAGQFVADVTVDDAGLVIDYGNIWSREVGA